MTPQGYPTSPGVLVPRLSWGSGDESASVIIGIGWVVGMTRGEGELGIPLRCQYGDGEEERKKKKLTQRASLLSIQASL